MKTLFKTIVLLLLSLLFIHCKPEPIEPEPIDYRDKWCGDYACNTDYYNNDTTVIVSIKKVNDSLVSISNLYTQVEIQVDTNGHFFERGHFSCDVFSGDLYKDSINFWMGFYLVHNQYYYHYNGIKQ
jgi:hypothetical protein